MTEERVEVRVMGVYMDQDESRPAPHHFVLFCDPSGRRMPIWVGQFEAWAISYVLAGEIPERPFTYDMLLNCLAAAGTSVEEVFIHELRDETFYALLSLRVGEQVHALDVRPSDAVAVALRAKCPLFVSEAVMAACQR